MKVKDLDTGIGFNFDVAKVNKRGTFKRAAILDIPSHAPKVESYWKVT